MSPRDGDPMPGTKPGEAFDGHTCHEGHTDAEHLAMYRAVVREVRAALEGAS